MAKLDLATALQAVEPETKAAQIRQVMPIIEQQLKAGVRRQAILNVLKEQGIEISLSTLRPFVSEEALNELSRLAAQYSDVNCTPDDIRLYLDRIARGTPVAGKAAEMSNDDLIRYLQSMREKKQGTDPADD